jgi:homoserine kinase
LKPQPISAHARVTAYAPATVANLGIGFDILGMALDAPGDEVTVTPCQKPGVHLMAITGDRGQLSTDPVKNTACIAAQAALNIMQASEGVELWLDKGLPLASGLGSSAASAAAAAVAVNNLFGEPLSPGDLLLACLEAEAAVSGRHADNIAPALWGGIVLVNGLTAADIYPLPVPDHLVLALVTPDIPLPTATARSVLPSTIPLRSMVTQTGLVATFIHALYENNLHLMAETMQRDAIITTARASLIPGMEQVQQASLQAGALACIISGAGPTLCAICDSPVVAEKVTAAMTQVYDQIGIPSQSRVAYPSPTGTVIRQHSL